MRDLNIVIFSKDRAAQLDLLLQSMRRFLVPGEVTQALVDRLRRGTVDEGDAHVRAPAAVLAASRDAGQEPARDARERRERDPSS